MVKMVGTLMDIDISMVVHAIITNNLRDTFGYMRKNPNKYEQAKPHTSTHKSNGI